MSAVSCPGRDSKLCAGIWGPLTSPGMGSSIRGQRCFQSQHCASSTHWTRFLFKLFVCFPCSSLEPVEKQLANACKLICPPLLGSLQGSLRRGTLSAVQRKSVLRTHCILTPYPCQGLSQPNTSQRSKAPLAKGL